MNGLACAFRFYGKTHIANTRTECLVHDDAFHSTFLVHQQLCKLFQSWMIEYRVET